MFKLILFGTALAFIASCSPKSNSNQAGLDHVRPLYLGDLEKKAQDIYAAKNEGDFYQCDFQQRHMVLEIAKALEDNKTNIHALQKTKFKNNFDYKTVIMNGFDFIDNPRKDDPDVWESYSESWQDIYNYYLKIKNNPLDERWTILNSAARSHIWEDEIRIINGQHPGVRRKDEDVILRTANAIEKCFLDTTCTKVSLQPDEEKWLREGVYHSWILDRADSEDIFERKRKRISFLKNQVGWSATRFKFQINPSISTEGSTLVVPLDLTVLGKDADQFIMGLNKTWGHHGLDLKIINSPNGFKLKISDTPGERAYVSFQERIMQLFSPTKLTTVDHEFGHILGLMDTYYTSFNQTTCGYEQEYNRGDLMSFHGKVLPVHIEKIKSAYGL